MRGKRRQWPGCRQRWKRPQGPARPSSPCRDLLPAGGEKEVVIPGSTRDPLEERASTKRPLLPAGGEKVRMRGKRHQWPGDRQRWKSSQGAARPSSPCRDLLPAGGEKGAVIPEAADYPGPIGGTRQHQTPPSPRRRGEGEDEGQAPSVAGMPTEVEKTARPRPPLIPLPGPSPRRRGEGGRHPGSRRLSGTHWRNAPAPNAPFSPHAGRR